MRSAHPVSATMFSLLLAIALGGSTWAQIDVGLVAYYPLHEGSGAVAVDKSGHGNNGRILGGAKWTDGSGGQTLEFNGQDTYIDCSADKTLDISSRGTIEFWCNPRTVQGGLVGWNTGSGWEDERLAIAVNTYSGGLKTLTCIANGKMSANFNDLGILKPGEWKHLAVAFDGRTVFMYRDGLLAGTDDQSIRPLIAGVPLWIGRCRGLGKECFHGLIDEVRIYNRTLSPEEILVSFKRQAECRGKDTSYFRKVNVAAHVYPVPGKIAISLDARAMKPLPEGAKLRTRLCLSDSDQPMCAQDGLPIPAAGTADVLFDLQGKPVGQLVVASDVVGPDGSRIGEESSTPVAWSGQPEVFKNIRILNNFVWELLNVQGDAGSGVAGRHTFILPYDRWVFIRTTADTAEGGRLWISVDSEARDTAAVTHVPGKPSTLEAMRFLTAGQHTVHIAAEGNARLKQLVVRAIPILQHAFYGANPHVHPYGPYDWQFLAKDVLPNINTMISSSSAEPPELKEWKMMGRSWIGIINVPQTKATGDAAVDEIYKHWCTSAGLTSPLMDGIIVDEFGGGDEPIYDVYRKAVERVYANPRFKGKAFLPYGGIFHHKDRSAEFARVAIDGGGHIAWEQYLIEQPDAATAAAFIKRSMADEMPRWEERFPEAARRIVLVLGYMSQPTESLNVNPSTDFRVYMDMQFRLLATHPAFFGLAGLQEYHSSYCDEENVRLAGRLYRHYAIEGKTEPLITDPYELTHIRNPDFADGTSGWTLSSAEQGSIKTGRSDGYSWLQGRYPRTDMGDTFLLTRRSAAKPNVFSQEIRKLEPGRLYSMKMITGNYQDLLKEKSSKIQHAVTLKLEGVNILPGAKKSFQFAFPNNYGHTLGKFNVDYTYWMNYHWRVFRAKGTAAKLVVSDWASDSEPGGPIGQELMYNFIEVQPYIGD